MRKIKFYNHKEILPIGESAKAEILSECLKDPHGGLCPLGMVRRIRSAYYLNVSQMGKERALDFISETYNFTRTTCENIIISC